MNSGFCCDCSHSITQQVGISELWQSKFQQISSVCFSALNINTDKRMLDSQSQLSISYPLLVPQKGKNKSSKAPINLFHGSCPDHIFMILLNFKQATPCSPQNILKTRLKSRHRTPQNKYIRQNGTSLLEYFVGFFIKKGFFFGQILSYFLSCPVIVKQEMLLRHNHYLHLNSFTSLKYACISN